MRLASTMVCALFLGTPLAAEEDRTPLYGIWGDAAQCAGTLLIPGGTVRAEPFEIRPGWLRRGQHWCRLSWFPVEPRANGLFVSARALCGEDSARAYRLDLVLEGDTLRLIWDESLGNGPLQRCGTK